MMSDINSASMLHTLRLRYARDDIFTAIGPVLIVVNPYKPVRVCSGETFASLNELEEDDLPPHVFRIATAAFAGMVRTRKAQSILISGESGAGKTETTKMAMSCLAEISGSSGAMTEKCLESGIVLEAFGNAKTVYNNNSSRFGKWCAVHFDREPPARASVSSREVARRRRRRRREEYHLFYQRRRRDGGGAHGVLAARRRAGVRHEGREGDRGGGVDDAAGRVRRKGSRRSASARRRGAAVRGLRASSPPATSRSRRARAATTPRASSPTARSSRRWRGSSRSTRAASSRS